MKDIFKNSIESGRVVIDENNTVVVYKQMDEVDVLNFYFEKDGKKFFFKANSKYTLDVSELLSYALDKEINEDATAFLPAVFKTKTQNYYGVISEDIRKDKTDELISGANLVNIFETESSQMQTNKRKERFNTIEHYKLALSFMVGEKKGVKISLEKDFFVKLAKYMMTGFIRSDEDMHAHNIPILIKTLKKNHKLITLGKLFDNSMSFLIKSHRSDIRDEFEFLSPKEKLEQVEKSLNDAGFLFQVKSTSNRQTGRLTIAREIANLIVKYPELKTHYEAYKNLRVKKVLTDFKQENNYDFIKESDIELASLVVRNSLELLENAINYENMQNSGPFKFLKQANDEPDLEF